MRLQRWILRWLKQKRHSWKNSVVRATLKENNNAGNWSTLFIPQGAIFLYNFKGLQHFLKDAVSHNLLDAV